MGQLLIRKLDDADIVALKRMAKSEGVSLEEYMRTLVREHTRRDKNDVFTAIDGIFEGSDYRMSRPAEDLVREDRDR